MFLVTMAAALVAGPGWSAQRKSSAPATRTVTLKIEGFE
jgi:hypothetical protein